MTGERGPEGFAGAFYAKAIYNAGNTNEGAIAAVACNASSSNYTAITGGVQVLGIGSNEIDAANSRNTPVSSSFPGRMDWSTNSPRRTVSTAGSSSSVATLARWLTRRPRRSSCGRCVSRASTFRFTPRSSRSANQGSVVVATL